MRRTHVREKMDRIRHTDGLRFADSQPLGTSGMTVESAAETGPLVHIERDRLYTPARKWMSTAPRPFLRWAGSKRAHLLNIIPALPNGYRTYWEPFLGGGSLFFLLQPESAVLGDSCQPLIGTYRAVRDGPRSIIDRLQPMAPNKDLFYEVRDRKASNRFAAAADFIYLNKTCWNGLYRVNARGEFNVPYGRPKSDGIFDPSNLLACSDLLSRPDVTLTTNDFERTLADVDEGDLVFLDPPYVTGHNDNGFVDYNEKLFSWEDQRRLASIARDLVKRGASVVATNANHSDILRLYDGFEVRGFSRLSTLAGDVAKRGLVREVVMYAWSPGLRSDI